MFPSSARLRIDLAAVIDELERTRAAGEGEKREDESKLHAGLLENHSVSSGPTIE